MRVNSVSDLKEGDVFDKFISNRLFKNNENALCVTTGGTGSGKTFKDLRQTEIHYQRHFKDRFPDINKRIIQNTCFSLDKVSERLTSGDLERGEILIIEEAGVQMGNLDFQNKTAKMFNYVLQCFRSKNIGLLFNLPVYTMLNKTARQLLHFHMLMVSIDYKKKMSKCKPFYLQLNRMTGKVYPKYPRIIIGGVGTPIKRLNYRLPNQELIDMYEKMKDNFVDKQTRQLKEHLEDKAYEKRSNGRLGSGKPFTNTQKLIFKIWNEGITNQTEIAKELSKLTGNNYIQPGISREFGWMNGKNRKWREIPLENGVITL